MKFDVANLNPIGTGSMLRRNAGHLQAMLFRSQIGTLFQRILRRDNQPQIALRITVQNLFGQCNMPFMDRVKRSAIENGMGLSWHTGELLDSTDEIRYLFFSFCNGSSQIIIDDDTVKLIGVGQLFGCFSYPLGDHFGRVGSPIDQPLMQDFNRRGHNEQ